MPVPNLKKNVKKILKPVAKIVASILVWIILFTQNRIVKSNRSYLPALLASLCFNDSLVFKIDPRLLKYHVHDPDILPGNLFVWPGDWDKEVVPLNEHEKFVIARELFVENKDCTSTTFYKYAVSQMEKGCSVKRGDITLDSLDNISRYFKKQERLFEEIKNGGFDLSLAPETGAVIARDGSIIHFRQGHHTLAIVKILGVENVILRIRAVHSIWLSNQVKGKGLFLIKAVKRSFKELAMLE